MKSPLALFLLVLCVASPPAFALQKANKKGKPNAKPTSSLLVPGLRATLTTEPDDVEVGEPMRWTLEIHHPKELIPILPGTDLGLGPHWVVLEDYGATAEASPDGINEAGFWITRKSWQVLGLAGIEVLPSMEIFFGEGEAALSVMTSEGKLAIESVLGADDEFARPRRGFRDPRDPSPATEPLPWWLLAPAVTLVLVAGWWILIRKRTGANPVAKVAPLDQLTSMEQNLPDDLQALQSLYYSLTSLVREATEERLGQSWAGTTDAEWLDLVRSDARVSGEIEEHLGQVFESAESVKYARIKPTSWAVEEVLGAARGVIESMDSVSGGRS